MRKFPLSFVIIEGGRKRVREGGDKSLRGRRKLSRERLSIMANFNFSVNLTSRIL
jgi:hypothetical protein